MSPYAPLPPPGGYTVVGSSAVEGGTGIVLVEVYVVEEPARAAQPQPKKSAVSDQKSVMNNCAWEKVFAGKQHSGG